MPQENSRSDSQTPCALLELIHATPGGSFPGAALRSQWGPRRPLEWRLNELVPSDLGPYKAKKKKKRGRPHFRESHATGEFQVLASADRVSPHFATRFNFFHCPAELSRAERLRGIVWFVAAYGTCYSYSWLNAIFILIAYPVERLRRSSVPVFELF